MEYKVRIKGLTPIIMHDVIGGMDETSPARKEIAQITKKRGQKTDAENERLRELETLTSLWYNVRGEFGIPERAIRAMLEGSARTMTEGNLVRQGLIVLRAEFEYDQERYGVTEEELSRSTQFTIPVRVGQSRVNRTRAMIEGDWACTFLLDVEEDLIDQAHLEVWLKRGGRRMGLGDWRPSKSGLYGMFATEYIEVVPAEEAETALLVGALT